MMKEHVSIIRVSSESEARKVLEYIEENTDFYWANGMNPTKYMPPELEKPRPFIILFNLYSDTKSIFYRNEASPREMAKTVASFSEKYDVSYYSTIAEYMNVAAINIQADSLSDFLKGGTTK